MLRYTSSAQFAAILTSCRLARRMKRVWNTCSELPVPNGRYSESCSEVRSAPTKQAQVESFDFQFKEAFCSHSEALLLTSRS